MGNYTVYIDPNTGFDLSEMYSLTVLGGVLWSHGLRTYFQHLEDGENNIPVINATDTLPYTEMEHHLDEVFGYFGAARKFYAFTDEELASQNGGKKYKDNYPQDGFINFRYEYNFTFAVMAAQIDLWSTSKTDYSKTIYDGFYYARKNIIDKKYDSLIINKQLILENWEEIVSAHSIHGINNVIQQLELISDNQNHDPELLFKYWSQMFKYTEMLRYNYNNRFNALDTILNSTYTNINIPHPKHLIDNQTLIPGYIKELRIVRNLFQSEYNFLPENVENW